MKKFFKFVLTLSFIAAIVAGVLYFVKNILMKDYLDDYDDDFDNDLFEDDDEEGSDRDYVTIKPDGSSKEETEETDDAKEDA